MDKRTNHLPFGCRPFGDHDGAKDHESGLGDSDHWRFTPSMLDTNSYAFTAFANQHSGDFTPTPTGGMNAVFHNQAGDLHTPGMGFHLGTPLSMSASEGHTNTASAVDIHGFHPHLLHTQTFQNSNPFAQQESYAPSSFVHQDSGYETMNPQQSRLPNEKLAMDSESHRDAHYAGYSARIFDNVPAPSMQPMEKSVFRTIALSDHVC